MKKFLLVIILIGVLIGALIIYFKASDNEQNLNMMTPVVVNNSKPLFKMTISNNFLIDIAFDNNYKLFSLKHLNEEGRKITNYYTWSKENLTTMLLRIVIKAMEEKYDVETLNLNIYDNIAPLDEIKIQINEAINIINVNNNYNIKINYL